MSITKKDVDYLCKLCKIQVNPKEELEIIKEINEVVTFMEDLKDISLNSEEKIVNPYYIENNFREDDIEESMNIEEVLKNSIENKEEYFLVPKIIK